ncbi:hypothetical protein CPAR01_04557 [Colletotrichum paranaense]|uniref:Uncharacterized protein n=1 Tax=Colletotrichum paranaense TaxID=1914294 RepID=A0ABQ9SXB7_9PEZI|nr:uncharacterized protein CPAR01_04557 [Colletotrichum paranaense]KAK1543924.1 hypothetical protein CPAR01_04557 [Colletotrichum paranaense]
MCRILSSPQSRMSHSSHQPDAGPDHESLPRTISPRVYQRIRGVDLAPGIVPTANLHFDTSQDAPLSCIALVSPYPIFGFFGLCQLRHVARWKQSNPPPSGCLST